MKNNKLPWLDQNGLELSNSQLKNVSKNWNQKIWQQYLDWLEHKGSESLISSRRYDHIKENMTTTVFDSIPSPATNSNSSIFERSLLNALTIKQKQVIEKIYWKGLSVRQTAAELNISSTAVHKCKKRALQILRNKATKVNSSPYMKDKTSFSKTGSENASEMLELAERKTRQTDQAG